MLIKAIENAYRIMRERGWDTIYWAIDLHGVCLKSTYVSNTYELINDKVIPALKIINSKPETKIIIWSGIHEHEKLPVRMFFADHGVKIDFFNCNPLENDTATGGFTEKFYFNILLDDKAGFDPETDWDVITQFYRDIDSGLKIVPPDHCRECGYHWNDHEFGVPRPICPS